ncbi:hypothetical protein SCHPADRAFT_829238 [Schizopora paradoxa]|uniref:Uncharacterized protein n=1 Tax=Schizopora paradoxa TaxID=27342 RepID=A0A0H2RL73_9AGAM|nr:hypothetical protein SCHPADRAFT_829238 [Schizopora paradoxa]
MAFTCSDIFKVRISSSFYFDIFSFCFLDHVRLTAIHLLVDIDLLSFSSLAVILPPLGVFLERGCGSDLVSLAFLTFVALFPGIIHALYIILKY